MHIGKLGVAGLAILGVMGQMAALAQDAPMPPLRPDQIAFLALYKELVETNTSLSAGSCTLAAERMAAHLKAAGFADKDITMFSVPEHPKEGGLVAILVGTSKTAKPMLLLGHLDVVEAKRADWTRDPFTLIEEGGYFYGRGSSDDKAQAAIWTDLMIRLRQEGYKPRRAVKLALTCGEEGGGQLNGASWLAQNQRPLIDAAFAFNEGAGGDLDASGKRVAHYIQAGEIGFESRAKSQRLVSVKQLNVLSAWIEAGPCFGIHEQRPDRLGRGCDLELVREMDWGAAGSHVLGPIDRFPLDFICHLVLRMFS